MSFDEYCLQQYSSNESFFYLWQNSPAVIVGLNQNVYSEVNLDFLKERGICLARRVTGGGAVYHDLNNLNYTFVGQNLTPQPIVDALKSLGINAELSGRNDIFVDGRKVSGYAKRVWKERELIHGTLMYDVDLDTLTKVLDTPSSKLQAKGIASVRSRVANLKEYLPADMSFEGFVAHLAAHLSSGDSQMELPDGAEEQIRSEAQSKFASWDWVYGRSKEADFQRRGKYACGTVELSLSLKGGCIDALRFEGDFVGEQDAAEFSARLLGLRFEREIVWEAVRACEVGRYFEGTSAEEIFALLIGN
ncbi:MAG: lipoate--protein ligase [Bacteroidales bacterium]|nr:lipoate--protein ligase [Bacteroidales bacterium]